MIKWCSNCEIEPVAIGGVCRTCFRAGFRDPLSEPTVEFEHVETIFRMESVPKPKIAKPPTVRTISERVETGTVKPHKKPRQKGAVEIKLEKKEKCWFCTNSLNTPPELQGALCRNCKDQLKGLHDYTVKRFGNAKDTDNSS